jgi:hypothetical protein
MSPDVFPLAIGARLLAFLKVIHGLKPLWCPRWPWPRLVIEIVTNGRRKWLVLPYRFETRDLSTQDVTE